MLLFSSTAPSIQLILSQCAENIVFGNASLAGVSSSIAPGIISPATGLAPKLELVVAVANDGRGVINPCGRCRQMMLDYYPDIKVIVKAGVIVEAGSEGEKADLKIVGMEELLPFAYVTKKYKA